MSDFDPYYKWLGIPPQEQPPNHYRLLGLQVLEQNLEVIAAAANRQMAYLQELSSGNDHIDEAQGLLGEVARARVCLLAAESKARYDAELVSTLDSLPEAEEAAPENVAVPEFDSAAPRRPAARRSGGKKRTSTTRRSGRRSPPTKNASRGAAREEEEVATPTGASSLQVKLAAAVIPGVIVVVIGIVWMVAGGDSSSKQGTKNDRENKTGSEASPGQGVEKDSLAAATTKFGNQAEQTASNRPPTPVVKPPKADSQPESSKLDKPSQPPAVATPPSPPETLSAEEKARLQLTKTYKLEEEDFSHTWHLVNEQTRNLEALETSGSSGTTGGADFEAELKHRVEAKKKEIMDRWIWISQQPEGNPQLDAEYYHLMTIVAYPDNAEARYVRDEISEITSIRAEVEQEFASRGPATVDPGMVKLIKDIRTRYSELAQKAEVINLLEKAGGTLAKPPALPEATNPESTQFTSAGSPADDPSNNNSEQDDPSTGSGDKGEQKKPTKPEPTLSYAELKDQLTALENETRLALGKFNKGAKEYIKQKKGLVKRIKAGEAMRAQRSQYQDSLPEGEEKIKFGEETEAKVIKPLDALKSQLQGLSQPDIGPIEGNLKQAEKLLKQIEGTPTYQEKPGSIDSLAAKIAKYRKGFNVQQARMAN